MNDLKPCPFCGGEAIVEIGTKSKIVFCTRCKARTNRFAEYNEEKNAEKAVEAWNRRREIKELFCEITIDGEEILHKAIEEVELDGKTIAEWLELVKGYKQLEQELAAVKRERDAAAADAAIGTSCNTCLHAKNHPLTNPCMACGCYHNFWEWRGVCPDTEVQDDAL